MAISGERTIDVSAPRSALLAALRDIDSYPDWQPDCREATVLERDAEGRPAQAELVQDAEVRTVRVRVRYEHRDDGFSWSLVDGDVAALEGSYVLEEAGPGVTRVTYALWVDPGGALSFLLRGPAVDGVRDRIMDGTLQALRHRVAT